MSAASLLAELRARGIAMAAAGDKLRYRPATALTDADRAALRASRDELLGLICWDDAYPDLTDEQFQAVCNADVARFGFYTPQRCYPSPAEPPEAIWRRMGLGMKP